MDERGGVYTETWVGIGSLSGALGKLPTGLSLAVGIFRVLHSRVSIPAAEADDGHNDLAEKRSR